MKNKTINTTLVPSLAVAFALTTAAFSPLMHGQSLVDFGYGRMTVNGTSATGARPLAVVLMNYGVPQDVPGSPVKPLAHNATEYRDLIFNFLHTSVNGYFMENSHGMFHWIAAGAGVYGPFNEPTSAWDTETPTDKSLAHLTLALRNLAAAGFNFAEYDANGDGVITTDELSVLVIDNMGGVNGGNRWGKPKCFVPDGQNVNVCLSIPSTGDRASLMTIAHELSHQLGAVEMYGGSGGENFGYSLMGATQFSPLDDRRTFHQDPWHKLMLGWIQPSVHSMDTPGKTTINAAQLGAGNSLILYSPSLGPNEYYLLEFRTAVRKAGPGYDANAGNYKYSYGSPASQGLMIWHVQTQGIGGPDINSDVYTVLAYDQANCQSDTTKPPVPCYQKSTYTLGAPTFVPGQGYVWAPNTKIPYPLTSATFQPAVPSFLTVGNVTNNGDTIEVSWGPEPATPVRNNLLLYNQTITNSAAGYIDDATASFQQLSSPGPLGAWTTVAGGNSEILLYNMFNGALDRANLDGAGNFKVFDAHKPGSFGTGWTHIVYHKTYWFFYNANTGAGAVGAFVAGAFQQYNSFHFSANWTSIVSTPNGLLFYNSTNGMAAIGDWHVTSGSAFGPPVVNFTQTASYVNVLSSGWTNIVQTSNGLVFYNAHTGVSVVGDIKSNGTLVTRPLTLQNVGADWTAVTTDGTNILLYNAVSGDVAIAAVHQASLPLEFSPGLFPGGLTIRATYPMMFSPGWTQVAATAPPAHIQ